MSKAILYAANTNAQTGTVNFGSIIRRYGQNISLSGGNPVLRGAGYYRIDTNFTIVGTAAGVATVTLYKDGLPITGATVTLTVAADEQYAVSIPAIVREVCCNESTITAVLTNATVNNASIVVEKE